MEAEKTGTRLSPETMATVEKVREDLKRVADLQRKTAEAMNEFQDLKVAICFFRWAWYYTWLAMSLYLPLAARKWFWRLARRAWRRVVPAKDGLREPRG